MTVSLSILPTKVATSASVERANSALRHVKTDFCSMMGEERVNTLFLYIFFEIYSLIMTK